jgi:hypothetical protein
LIFIPGLSIAFEYQGEPHYFSTSTYGSANQRQESDQVKAQIAKGMGITLIHIPFWWDKSSESLSATLRHYRPDLDIALRPGISPIPLKMPSKYERTYQYKPNIPQKYDEKIDPSGW